MLPVVWKDKQCLQQRRAGLTMLEVLTVMALFAIMLSLIIGLSRHADAAAKRNRALADLMTWQAALEKWRLEFGIYPPLENNSVTNLLDVYVSTPSTNLYFKDTRDDWRLYDPWGSMYQYYGSNQSCRIWSFGPDCLNGTADDLDVQP